jgi:hypothetical protein
VARRASLRLALIAAVVMVVATLFAGTIVWFKFEPDALTVSLNGDQLSIGSHLGDSRIGIEATLRNSATNRSFNLVQTVLDGTAIHHTGDDVAPIRTSLGTVGGNHGFPRVAAFTNPDGKTTADLGSVWTDGTREYVLLAIGSAGELIMGGDYEESGDGVVTSRRVVPSRDLEHVSGALRRGRVPAGGSTQVQLRPSTGRVEVSASCDGGAIGRTEQQCRKVTVKEAYDVLDYADLYDQARAHVGTSYTELPIEGAVRIENRYTFTAGGFTRLHSELTALKPTLLSDTGLVQAAALAAGKSQTVIRQVPGVRPIAGQDFRRGVDLSSHTENVTITSSDLLNPEAPPTFSLDRLTENGQTRVGFAIGYVPTGNHAGSQEARSESAGVKLWDLRSTGKSYPVAVTGLRLGPGEGLTVEGIRTYLTAAQADEVARAVAEDDAGAWRALGQPQQRGIGRL